MRELKSRADLSQLAEDAGIIKIEPAAALVAESEGDVADAVKEAIRRGLPLTARGGGTSIPTQSVGSGVILLQDRRGESLEGSSARVEPGVVKADLNSMLARYGVWMPVDPSSYESCTVGGMVANNSSGVRTLKYGSTIDYVEEVRAVLADGSLRAMGRSPEPADRRFDRIQSLLVENWKDIVDEKPRVTKNSSGYRLERGIREGRLDPAMLLVGSEGTLGVLTEVSFRTVPRPRWRVLLIVEATLDELDAKVSMFLPEEPAAVELVDKSVFKQVGKEEKIRKFSRTDSEYMLFCEFDGEEGDGREKVESVADSGVASLDPLVVTDTAEVSEAWGVRNETLRLGLEIRRGSKVLVPGVEDLVVPQGRLGDLVKVLRGAFESRGLAHVTYGHAGDANLHSRPLLDPTSAAGRRLLDDIMAECFEKVWNMGGSMSGEHGDGRLRAPYVERQYPRTYWLMREVRETLDPKGLLNPGVKIV